jgi:hypothetical protein
MSGRTMKKLRGQKLPAAAVIISGLLLLTYMILVEDEPGAVPLLFIIIGTVWYLIIRKRIRSELHVRK